MIHENPILNAKYSIRVNPLIDIGETVGVIDYRYFKDNNVRDFGVVSVKHTFVGAKMQTELNLTLITKSGEMYLQDIFTRLNALEEKDKGDKDVLNRLLYFTDTYEILDDPESNLDIRNRSISGNNLIWDNPYFGIWDYNNWSDGTHVTSFVLGNPRGIIGVNKLGINSEWSTLVINL